MRTIKFLGFLLLLACFNFSFAQEPKTLPVPTAEEIKLKQKLEKERLKEAKSIEHRIAKAERGTKKAEKARRKAEKSIKSKEKIVSQIESRKKAIAKDLKKIEKIEASISKGERKGKLSPVDIKNLNNKIAKLHNNIRVNELKLEKLYKKQ